MEQNIEHFKIELYKYSPYLYYLLTFIPVKEDSSIPRACVSIPLEIRYNPIIMKEPVSNWGYIIVHELYHILFSHLSFLDNLNRKKWNIATDLFINNIIDKSQTFFKNEESLKPVQFPYIPMSVIESSALDVYSLLKDSDIEANDCFELVPGDFSDEEIEEIKEQLEVRIGDLPEMIRKKFIITHKSESTYKRIFKNAIANSYKSYSVKQSYYKLNKYNPDFPAIKLKPIPKIGIIVDVSGSMSSSVNLIYNEIAHILKQSNTDGIIIEIDTTIQRIFDFKSKKDLELKASSIKGFGGTDMTKAVTYLNKQNIQNVIYLTDGMLSYPSVDPKFNLIIGLINSKTIWDKKFEKHKIIEINEVK